MKLARESRQGRMEEIPGQVLGQDLTMLVTAGCVFQDRNPSAVYQTLLPHYSTETTP